MHRRAIISGILLALLAGAAVVFVAMSASARRPVPQAVLEFLSFTNRGMPDPLRLKPVIYEDFAAFRLTNASPYRVFFRPETLEVWTGSTWQTNRIAGTCTNWPHLCDTCGPFEKVIIYVPPPINSKWRVRLFCKEHAQGFNGYRDRIRDAIYNLRERGRGVCETFSGPQYEILSQEVVAPGGLRAN